MTVEGLNRNVVAFIRDANGNLVHIENGALATITQDQYSEILGRPFSRQTGGPYLLASPMVQDSRILTFQPGHGLVTGNNLKIISGDRQVSMTIVNVATDTVTLDSPVPFGADSPTITSFTPNMNVNGSVTPLRYAVSVPADASYSLDVKGVRLSITSGDEMDDSLFASLAPLTYGVSMMAYHANGTQYLHWNIKTNQCMQMKIDNFAYSPKAKQGEFGLLSDWRLDNCGVVVRLLPGSRLEYIIQDDLSALLSFKSWMYGHVVVD